MKKWLVAHTQANKESLAEDQLQAQGYEIYLPRYRKIRRHSRKVDTVLAPLFPRYIFVGINVELDKWRSINGTRGVSYLLMNNEQPAIVAAGIIESLKAQEVQEGVVLASSVALFAKGDKLRVLEGAFKDQTAIFETLDNKSRVQLLLTFLGREMKIFLPIYGVEAL